MSCQLDDDEIVFLKKENCNLKQRLKEKEKEIEHLKVVISNLKGITMHFFSNFKFCLLKGHAYGIKSLIFLNKRALKTVYLIISFEHFCFHC